MFAERERRERGERSRERGINRMRATRALWSLATLTREVAPLADVKKREAGLVDNEIFETREMHHLIVVVRRSFVDARRNVRNRLLNRFDVRRRRTAATTEKVDESIDRKIGLRER